MKYEDNKYACIKDIVDHIGDEISAFLPQIQSRDVIPHACVCVRVCVVALS